MNTPHCRTAVLPQCHIGHLTVALRLTDLHSPSAALSLASLQVRINRTAQLRFVLASTLAGMADSDTHPPTAQDGNDPDATGKPGQEHAAATQATLQATSHAASLASLVAPAAVERSTDAGLSPAAAAALDVDAARKVRVAERSSQPLLPRTRT